MPKFNSYPALSGADNADTFLFYNQATGAVKQIVKSNIRLPSVATMALLKAINTTSGVNTGDVIELGGFYDYADGGGGTFVFDASSVEADNKGTIIAPTTGSGRWYRIFDEKVSVKWFGAVGDGSADDTVAFNAAFSLVGKWIVLPSGEYRVTSNLVSPLCCAITGEGRTSIIKPGSSVTKCLVLDSGGPTNLADFAIDGSAATGAVGLVVGDSDTWSGDIQRVYSLNFSGAGGVGVHFKKALKSALTQLFATGSKINVLLDGSSFPTTLTFIGGYFGIGPGYGLKVLSGYSIKFIGTIFESNTNEGVYIPPTGADATEIDFIGCWFEDNWGATTTEYQFKAIATARTARVQLRDCYFVGTAATAKSILLDGAGVSGITLSNPQVPSTMAAGIRAQNGAYGTVYFPRNLSYSSIVSDPSGNLRNVEQSYVDEITNNLLSAWTDWTPTFSSSSGNSAATFTGAPTIENCRYKLLGKTLMIEVAFHATLNAVTPTDIRFSLPASLKPYSDSTFTKAVIGNAGLVDGYTQFSTTAGVGIGGCFPLTGNFTSAAAVSARLSATIEVQ